MNSVFIKVSVSDRRPKKSGHYYTDKGKQRFNVGTGMFSSCKSGVTEYWFEEIEIPTEQEIYAESGKNSTRTHLAFERGASFILNHIKGGSE